MSPLSILHFQIKGEGFPILCLHGHPGNGQCMSCVYLGVVDPVAPGEDHEAGGEQHPGHDVNLLGLKLELLQPVDEVLLCLLQTEVGGDTQLRTSVPRYFSNERILKAMSVRVVSSSQN